jgi:hypothetical protein
MKKYLYTLLCLFLCQSCVAYNNPHLIIDEPNLARPVNNQDLAELPKLNNINDVPLIPSSQIISGVDWEITIPSGWVHEDIKNNTKLVEACYVNNSKMNLILLLKEEFIGSIDDYTAQALQELNDEGIIINFTQQIQVNDVIGNMYYTFNNDIGIWTLVIMHNTMVFSLSCGGYNIDNYQQDICLNVIKSFKLL